MLWKNILITQNNFPREKHDASCQGPEGPSCPYPIPKAPPLAKAQAPMPALGLSSPVLLRLQQLQLQFHRALPCSWASSSWTHPQAMSWPSLSPSVSPERFLGWGLPWHCQLPCCLQGWWDSLMVPAWGSCCLHSALTQHLCARTFETDLWETLASTHCLCFKCDAW